MEVALDTFAAALQYFFQRANVRGDVPPPPHEPRLDLK